MTDNPVLVPSSATVADALTVARRFGVHHLLVVDYAELVGVTCLCDLAERSPDTRLSALARSAFFFVFPEESVARAAALMRNGRVGCLPVVDGDGVLLGVVTRRDLRRAGVLGTERGVDCCAGCGDSHGLAPVCEGSELVFCRECRERARPPRERWSHTTLGGCD